jgi:uncharacterized protein YbjT (DUF2867 family)
VCLRVCVCVRARACAAKIGSQVVVPYRGDELDFRHLKVSGDLGQVVPAFYAVRDADRVRRLVASSDIVVNLIGRDYETRNFSFEAVHVDAAQTVARACREAGVTRLVHVSAAGAATDSPSRYLKSKALGEAAVRAEYPGATVVRPGWMFGHEDRLFNRIAYLHLMPTIPGDPILHQGEAKRRPVYVSDVAEGIVRASRTLEAAGKTYEFVGYAHIQSERHAHTSAVGTLLTGKRRTWCCACHRRPKEWTYMAMLQYFGEVSRRPVRPINYPTPILKCVTRTKATPYGSGAGR